MFTLVEKFIRQYAVIIFSLFGLVYLGNMNYLLFHSIIEDAGILLGCIIIMIFISFKNFNSDQNSFELLGIAYIFITFFGFLHSIFFKGSYFFSMESSNLAIQLYIIKQYIESATLFLLVYYYKKTINIKLCISFYIVVSSFMLLLVFYWSIFPICFIEGYGATLFLKISLLVISLILIMTTLLLLKKRKRFHNDTFTYLLYAIVFTIFMQTLYMVEKDVDGVLSLIGHILRAVSIYMMYKATVQVKIISPLIKLQDNAQKSEKKVKVKMTTTPYEENPTMIIIDDLSEQKKVERLKEKLKEEEEQKLKTILNYEQLKSNFYMSITHEFKTPLNVLLAIYQLLAEEDVPEKWKNYIKTGKQNCYRLWRLINNLIDNSKIDSKSFEIEMSNYNIVQIVEEITLSVADYLDKSSISITFDTNIEEKIITCDPQIIERILLNLISNGIKFSKEKGKILVNIVDGIDYVTIEVKDDGIGIDEDKINSIFDTFTKADDSLTRKSEGCGMGLSIVSSLVEILGGTIEVKSKKGYGSKFIIKIPASKSQLYQYKIHEVPKHKEKINIEFSDIYSE